MYNCKKLNKSHQIGSIASDNNTKCTITLRQSPDGLLSLLVFVSLPASRLCFSFYKNPEARSSLPLSSDIHDSILDRHLPPSPLSLRTGASRFRSCAAKSVIDDSTPFCLSQSRNHGYSVSAWALRHQLGLVLFVICNHPNSAHKSIK